MSTVAFSVAQGLGEMWGRARPSARAVLQARRLDRWLWMLPLITATFVSKLAIPPFGDRGLTVALPLICVAMVMGVYADRLWLDLRTLVAYLSLMVMLGVFQLCQRDEISMPSMLLLGVLHLPYVLRLQRVPDYATVLAWFRGLALLIAVLGVLQYSVQFAIGPAWAFPVENFLPAALRVSSFNMQGNLSWGSTVYRSNGVFMLEPSFFSQFMALGIVVELITLRRIWAVLLMGVSMLLSYSGTGVALLGVCLLFLTVQRRRWDVLLGLAVLLAAAGIGATGLLGDVPYVSVFLNRATEFSSQGSSGFARFVGGFYMFRQFLWDHVDKSLIGYGAGSFQVYALRAAYPVAEMAIFKMVFEFGLVGAAAYFGFLYYVCAVRSAAPAVLRLALIITFLLSGIYIPFGHALALSLLVWTTRKPEEEPDALARQPA